MDKPLKIVNASAGSGKTYKLVQEYLGIVLRDKNPHKYRSILAMTFTNKAANEMKSRILDGLIQLARPEFEKSPGDIRFLNDTHKNLGIGPKIIEERAQKILTRILHNYSAFSVMTIDKFTHRIIRTFARDLNISVDFDVELDLKTLRKNVTDLLFDQIGRNKDLTNLMMRYARTNLNQDKSWNFSSQVFDFSDLLFKEDAIKSIGLLQKLSSDDFLKVQEELMDENAKIVNSIESCAKEALDLIKSKGLDDADFAQKSSGIAAFFRRIAKGDYKYPSDKLVSLSIDNDWANKSGNVAAVDSIAPLLTGYFNKLISLLDGANKKLIVNREILKNLNNLSLLNHLLQLVEGVKEEQNILLISDFYRKISDIIINEKIPFIYERMGTRYEHFLLDEFQDTSHLQWINMIPLIHNSLSSGNTNLIVGDGKQAIYRWRNGEVEQFTNLPERIYNPENIPSLYEAEKLFAISGETEVLKKNYRSAPEIVKFNNELFGVLGKKMAPQLQYIYKESDQLAARSFNGFIESYFEDNLSDEAQLDYIHEVVQRSLEKGFELKDICILVRTNKKGSMIADYLTQKGIKVISPDSLFISKDLSVRFVFELMCSSAIPSDRNHKIKTLEHYSALKLMSDPSGLIEKYRTELTDGSIEEIFAHEKYSLKKYTAFDNLFEYAVYLTEIFELDVLTNSYLQFFLEEIHLYEKRNNSGIRDFMEWFTIKGAERSIVSPAGANAVQVMTIFKAKGLEFPVVICPFFDWKFKLHDQISWIENSDNKLPAFFVKMTKEIQTTDLSSVFLQEEGKYFLDQLNLLYVALTRAEVALFISADTKVSPSPASVWLKDYFNSLNWKNENGKISNGVFEKPDLEKSQTSEPYLIGKDYQKMQRPKMSFKSAENWDVHELDEKRLFGTNVHRVLAKLNKPEDLSNEIARLVRKGIITRKEEPVIREKIESLFENKKFASYFEGVFLNEKEIISESGKKLIPDKIILSADSTLIVDFKTGQKTESHHSQVKEYIRILEKMGYPGVRAEIFYTELMEADQISG